MTIFRPAATTPKVDASPRLERIAAVVAGVVTAAARDACRTRLVVLGHDSPEGALLERCLAMAGVGLPVEGVPVGADDAGDDAHALARRRAGDAGLLLNPASKTVAVLWPETLAEPVLPLADLYASQIAGLAGGWSGPAAARDLVERAGGVEAVDRFLAAHLDERRPIEGALAGIPEPAATELRDRLAAGWWWRRRLGVVPKLGHRTLGLELR